MAKLYVSEYAGLAGGIQGSVPIFGQPVAEQVVDYTGGSTQSVQFQPGTRWIVVSTDAICSIHLGYPANIALTTNYRLAANERISLRVAESPTSLGLMNIAAVTNT